MKIWRWKIAVMAGVMFTLNPVQAERPSFIEYQGFMDVEESGSVELLLRLYEYADPVEQEYILYEERVTVEVVQGYYSVLIGGTPNYGTLLEALRSEEVYIDVSLVDGESLGSREKLIAVPYALWAEGIKRGGITSEMIADQAVESVHLSAGAVGITHLTRDLREMLQDAKKTNRGDGVSKMGGSSFAATAEWQVTGNSGLALTNFLGTLDNVPVQIRVDNKPALRIEPTLGGVNMIGGHFTNSVATGIEAATIGGGGGSNYANVVVGDAGTVGGGAGNSAGLVSFVGGGVNNQATSAYAVVVGGQLNTAIGVKATVGGGGSNVASGVASVVPGGDGNVALGDKSLAAGYRAKANHQGAFVWADSTGSDFVSITNDEFAIRATHGVRIEDGGLSVEGALVAHYVPPAGGISMGVYTNAP